MDIVEERVSIPRPVVRNGRQSLAQTTKARQAAGVQKTREKEKAGVADLYSGFGCSR
jgi:hypothetical protein